MAEREDPIQNVDPEIKGFFVALYLRIPNEHELLLVIEERMSLFEFIESVVRILPIFWYSQIRQFSAHDLREATAKWAYEPETLTRAKELLQDTSFTDAVRSILRTLEWREAEHRSKTIRDGLSQHFRIDELRELAFDLGVNPNYLGDISTDRQEFVYRLISYFERDNRLNDLVERARELRPAVDFRGSLSDTRPPQIIQRSDRVSSNLSSRIRLDAAAPERVFTEKVFDLAVAIRNPDSPKLQEEGLDKVTSAEGTVVRKSPDEIVKFKIEVVQSPAFQINPQNYTFLLQPNTDSEVCFFSAIAKEAGQQSIIINASQVEDEIVVASTRLRLVVKMNIKPSRFAITAKKIAFAAMSKPSKATSHMSGEEMTKMDLLNQLDKVFNESELKELLFEFDIDIENIKGDTRREKMIDTIQYFARRNELPVLIEAMNHIRPNIAA